MFLGQALVGGGSLTLFADKRMFTVLWFLLRVSVYGTVRAALSRPPSRVGARSTCAAFALGCGAFPLRAGLTVESTVVALNAMSF
jgi:hypothetical protein